MAGSGNLASTTLSSIAASVATSAAAASSTLPPDSSGNCTIGNEYDGYLGARVSAIFVILIGSLIGACFPTFAARHRGTKIPSWAFFIAKYFGSGVIIATAFIHLLSPANDALRDPCLTGPITEYDWVSGIVLMTVFVLFFVEFMAMRYSFFDPTRSHSHAGGAVHQPTVEEAYTDAEDLKSQNTELDGRPRSASHIPGDDHLGHVRNHVDSGEVSDSTSESYSAQMTAIFILEFGVIFHSIFIGLTLAVSSPEEFPTLYVVLVFHQSFEGLGLGSRLASAPWPRGRLWTPYVLGVAYAFSTPIAIAIGLGVRMTYSPGSQTALITNGVCDSISAGILIYTGLVELMAHEFMFSESMRKAPLKTVLAAVGCMVLGAGLMALLGKWA